MAQRQWSALLVLVSLLGPQVKAGDNTAEDRMRRDITFLASDACEGRGIETKGIDKAAEFIVNEFKKSGLKAAGADGSYFQPFTHRGANKLGGPNSVILHGPQGQEIELRAGKDFQVVGLSAAGVVRAPVVFIGYAASAAGIGYDDFADVDVTAKVVLMIRKSPRPDSRSAPFDGNNAAYHASLQAKITNSEKHHAAAVVIVNDRETAQKEDRLMDFNYSNEGSSSFLPVVHLRRSIANSLLESGLGKSLTEVEADIDLALKPQSAPLSGWSADLDIHAFRPQIACKNIIGVVEGAGPLAGETVVVGAHYDHLGYGGSASLAGDRSIAAIHHGADDNGSGTTAILELARRFGRPPQDGARRRIVFMAFSAEESGLIGSRYYCAHPIFPLKSSVAMINLDMVGRLRPDPETHKDKLLIEGSGTAKNFNDLLGTLNQKYNFQMSKQASGFGPSDHASFYTSKIPVIFYWTGYHPDYHRPSDTSDKINVPGMVKVVGLAADTVAYLARVPERPQYVKIEPTHSATGRMSGPRLGITPTYGDDKEGVLLEGVNSKGPAGKAGLTKGDRIVEIAGKPVKNIEVYMALMGGRRAGDVIEVGIVRAGKKVSVKISLE